MDSIFVRWFDQVAGVVDSVVFARLYYIVSCCDVALIRDVASTDCAYFGSNSANRFFATRQIRSLTLIGCTRVLS